MKLSNHLCAGSLKCQWIVSVGEFPTVSNYAIETAYIPCLLLFPLTDRLEEEVYSAVFYLELVLAATIFDDGLAYPHSSSLCLNLDTRYE
jgi:hypothetical protein